MQVHQPQQMQHIIDQNIQHAILAQQQQQLQFQQKLSQQQQLLQQQQQQQRPIQATSPPNITALTIQNQNPIHSQMKNIQPLTQQQNVQPFLTNGQQQPISSGQQGSNLTHQLQTNQLAHQRPLSVPATGNSMSTTPIVISSVVTIPFKIVYFRDHKFSLKNFINFQVNLEISAVFSHVFFFTKCLDGTLKIHQSKSN